MIGRNSFGPVFVYDMLSLARRWQVYVARSAFVIFLLIGMTIAWTSGRQMGMRVGATPTLAELAKIGEAFFYALAGIQLSFILLAAPAAAAGSICIDRARGTLLHMMVTDLSDAEIVLGRLGARLAPVFGLVACGVPVVSISSLLGGIDFGALVGLFSVSIALAILGCSLALAISVKASKTHEVLMAVYLAFGVWLLALPIWWGMTRGTKIIVPPEWFQKSNPFMLVYSPYAKPGFVEPLDFAIFFVGVLIVSAALVAWSVLRMRREVIESTGRQERAQARTSWISKVFPSLPGPTLDGNPVLWREWHRNRPSRLARWLWRGLLTFCWLLVGWGVFASFSDGIRQNMDTAGLGLILVLFFGLLMVAATSATVLAEERTRGSLDILLSTPMSTTSIVMAKWWGAYRMVLSLAILPAFVGIFMAAASPDLPVGSSTVRWAAQPLPLTTPDRFLVAIFTIADFLVSGALIVSIGLALATWISRIGRAVGASVVVYFLLGIGWPILVETVFYRLFLTQYTTSPYRNQTLMQAFAALSPIFGSEMAMGKLNYTFEPRDFAWICMTFVVLIKLVGTLIMLGLTLATFNRCLGRVVESRPADWKRTISKHELRLLGAPKPMAVSQEV